MKLEGRLPDIWALNDLTGAWEPPRLAAKSPQQSRAATHGNNTKGSVACNINMVSNRENTPLKYPSSESDHYIENEEHEGTTCND